MTDIPKEMTHIVITEPGGPDVLQAIRTPVPTPESNEILIKVSAAGVNRPDVIQRQGKYPMPDGVTPVPGLEVAGEVVDLGSEVTSFAIGDEVCGLTNGGGYAEYCRLPYTQALPIPDGIGMIEAAAIPETFFTVWANLFDIGCAKTGETVLIHGGTSGIGTTALMLCKAFGIHTIATAGSTEKCEVIEKLGGRAINYRDAEFVDVVLQETNGSGVSVILDIMGASYFEKNMKALARDGRLVIIGFLGGVTAKSFNLQELALKRALVTGSTMRARTTAEKSVIAEELRNKVWPILADGRIRPIIHETFDLQQASQAHASLESGEHIGKLVLVVNH
ncbi:MAG: NAD(P)H quinone oxidoreductase [marine bacterium B5-7]|nr:MAG: NAD(P)H quinone oxidoreductase [marine bacterium B5-7]